MLSSLSFKLESDNYDCVKRPHMGSLRFTTNELQLVEKYFSLDYPSRVP
jgi:hypothetical protein